MKIIITLLCGSLLSASAFGVSRVGTGKLSNDDIGFMATYPQLFNQALVYENGDFRFDGSPVNNAANFGPPKSIYLFVYLLSNRLPQWQGDTDRARFRDHYLHLGWQSVPHVNPCIEQFHLLNGTNANWILSWGGGRGVVMTAPDVKVLTDRLKQMAADLELADGVCAWQ